MTIKPLGKRALVKLMPAEEKTTSGLIIPASAQEKTNQGKIVAIGNIPQDASEAILNTGDAVMYDKYAGTAVKIDGEEHILLEIKDILAILQ